MFTIKTREGKTYHLAELCFFEGEETPLLKVAEGQYLATKRGKDEKYPTISYIRIDRGRNAQKEEWSVLPVWVPEFVRNPQKVYLVKIDPEEIDRVFTEAVAKVIDEIEKVDT